MNVWKRTNMPEFEGGRQLKEQSFNKRYDDVWWTLRCLTEQCEWSCARERRTRLGFMCAVLRSGGFSCAPTVEWIVETHPRKQGRVRGRIWDTTHSLSLYTSVLTAEWRRWNCPWIAEIADTPPPPHLSNHTPRSKMVTVWEVQSAGTYVWSP